VAATARERAEEILRTRRASEIKAAEKRRRLWLLAGRATDDHRTRTAKRGRSGGVGLQNHEANGKSAPAVVRAAALKTDSRNEICTGKIRADRCEQHY
jgi:phage FluMu gp28-like protein